VILCAKPVAALRQYIRYYYQFEARLTGRAMLQPVPARSKQLLEFTFGTPYEVHTPGCGLVETAHTVAVVGAQTFRRTELAIHGRVEAFTIVFQAAGLHRLFQVPAERVTDDHFDGEAVLGRGISELERRLGDADSFSDRVQVADDYLCRRRPAFSSVGGIACAARDVSLSDGCVRVSKLASQTGLGVRQFERRFRYEIGIPPKLYARIVRFEAALQRKAVVPGTLWTNIAHDLGYHDQMHMVHDFNQLSGDCPTTIGGQLDFFVTPEIMSAGAQ
jgi:AraC-like DNA-binding protein